MAVIDLADQWEALPDASLVEEAQSGALDAFTELYERHHGGIFRHCRARLGNDHDAADAAQETFLRAWRALESFGGERRVGPWLRTIASNVCIDLLRARGRAVPVATFEPTADESAPDVRPDTAAVTAALARLSDRHREILQLREYQGWSYERIAQQQQLDLNAVKSLLWRARQSLRREFLLVSAQGRLSALGGLLLVRPAARLRNLFSDASAAVAQAGVAGGTAATAMVVTATVALPGLGTAVAPVPPPPAAAVVALEPAPAVVAPAAAPTAAPEAPQPESTPVLTQSAATVAPAEPAPAEAPPATPAPDVAAAPAEPAAPPEAPPAEPAPADEIEAPAPRGAEVRAERATERAAAAEERAAVKAERAEVKAERTAERKAEQPAPSAATGPPAHAGGPPSEPPGSHSAGGAATAGPPSEPRGREEPPGRSDDRPERGRPEDPGS